MLLSILPVPFADAGRQRQYEAVRAALLADTTAPATVLLGNLAAFLPLELDILLVRPTGLVLGVLTPQAGRLTIPALASGHWQLDGQPLPGRAGSDNPFEQYQRQLPVALAWLSGELGVPEADLPPYAGFALFEAPLTFGPDVERQLHAEAHDFQLVGDAAQLPARLPQPPEAGLAPLTNEELLEWGEYLAHEPYAAHERGAAEDLAAFLSHKLRQLWRWLGAEDIPNDPPYGGPLPDPHLRDQQEQARLQQLRQELQTELARQRQEAATREAARTEELAQLRQQLAQAGQPPAARQAEQQAQMALEEAMRAARAELATRNQELDARIQQLGRLMQQLQAQEKALPAPAAAFSAGPRAAPRHVSALPARATGAPARVARPVLKLSSYRPLRRAERWGVLGLVLALLGGGAWGVVRVVQQSAVHSRPATAGQTTEHTPPGAAQRPEPVIVYDTLANDAHLYHTDTADSAHSAPSPDAMPVSASPSPPLHVDSARLVIPETSLLPRDTTAAEASPAP